MPSPKAAEDILGVLDEGARNFIFPMLDNGYVYLAASRASLFWSPADWALVFEIFGFSPRAGVPDLHITTFGSRIASRKTAADFVSEAAYLDYLRLHTNDDSLFIYPIEDDGWIDPEDGECVAAGASHLMLRGDPMPIPSSAEYSTAGVVLSEPRRPFVLELCRALAFLRRDAVLATETERRTNVPEELRLLLVLDDWHHPNVVDPGCLPSQTETFRQLAAVLVSGDSSLYRPVEPANTRWSNWPQGGSL